MFGGKKKGDTKDGPQITLSKGTQSFGLSQLANALVSAKSLSGKKKAPITVFLPENATAIVNKTVSVTPNVTIQGSEGSVLLFQDEGFAKFQGTGIHVKDTSFVFETESSISVMKGGGTRLENCKFSVQSDCKFSAIKTNGALEILNSELNDVQIEVLDKGSLIGDTLTFKRTAEGDCPAAVSGFKTETPSSLKNSSISDYNSGVLFSGKGSLELADCTLTCVNSALTAQSSQISAENCTFLAPKGTAVTTSGEDSSISLKSCQFKDFETGLCAENSGIATLEDCTIDGQKSASTGVLAQEQGKVTLTKCFVKEMSEIGITIEGGEVKLKESEVSNNEKGGIFTTLEGNIEAEGLTCKENGGRSISLDDKSTGVFNKLTILSAEVGISVHDSSYASLKDFRCKGATEFAVDTSDSGLLIHHGKIVNSPQGVGLRVLFLSPSEIVVELRDVFFQKLKTGAIVAEPTSSGVSKRVQNASTRTVVDEMKSRCELQNCSFIQCEVGCDVNRAECHVLGCTFVQNTKHSIYIKNQFLKNVGQLRKEAKLKIRWANYLESKLEDSTELSNDKELLEKVTFELDFRMLQEFEALLYRPRLTERLRQARNFFRSHDNGSMNFARIIMKSVFLALKLVPGLTKQMLTEEMIDDPELGMFCATFQLDSDKRGKDNALVQMDDLMESWQELTRTRLFDRAVYALNEAFERKQVDEDLYDEWVTPLEELQREVYVKSKYNRRREYLLSSCKRNPVSAWYFLAKEDVKTEEGRKLSKEILLFIATDDEKYRLENTSSVHASWVAQWAATKLGETLCKQQITLDSSFYERKAWAEQCLDRGKAFEVLSWYNTFGAHLGSDMDNLMKFEALRVTEQRHGKLNTTQFKTLQELFGGEGFNGAMKVASRMFVGQGALPGFLRRVAENAKGAESLLEALAPVYQDPMIFDKEAKMRTILAVMSHFFLRDSKAEPNLVGTKELGYETCPSCFVQKLQPWNELSLESCSHNHMFCRGCLKESMSMGSQDMWGKCPGATDDGACTAIASRREMEMSGMSTDKVYNILRVRIMRNLEELEGWRACTDENCIGGRAKVKRAYFSCRLCERMVTEDGGESDPTVKLRLLKGLDGNSVARGEGVFRECFHCAVPYEKGNACSTITCAVCRKNFSMTWGDKNVNHQFEDNGVGPQRYVPKKPGNLWKLGVFKDRKGNPLKLGQQLSEAETAEVVRRAKAIAKTL